VKNHAYQREKPWPISIFNPGNDEISTYLLLANGYLNLHWSLFINEKMVDRTAKSLFRAIAPRTKIRTRSE
jgi:hypothetical protein